MRLLLLADLHLGARLLEWGDHAAERRVGIERAWAEAVDLALSSTGGADAVLIAGDLFDRTEPDKSLCDLVTAGVERWSEAGIPTVLLPGIHDGLYRSDSVYYKASWPSSVTVITSSTPTRTEIEAGGESVCLIARPPVPGEGSIALSPPGGSETGYGVGLFHALLEPSPRSTAWPIPSLPSSQIEESELDLVVLGGSHDAFETRCGRTQVVSPGTPVGLHPGETGDRFWTQAVLDKEGVRLEQQPCHVPSVVEIEADGSGWETVDELVHFLREQGERAAWVRLLWVGEDSILDDEELRAALAGLPFVVELRRQGTPRPCPGTGPVSGDSVEAFFLAELCRKHNETEDPERREVFHRALRAGVRVFAGGESVHED